MRLTARQIAQVCHEANRVLQEIQDDTGIPVAAPWDEFEDQATIIQGVVDALDGNITPEQSHENWCAAKRAQGWKYGEFKDVDRKTHPCLVPYAQLPEEQKVKDRLFLAIVQALAPKQSLREAFDQGAHGG